jgi:acetyltransferase-like isoleucine patch superfamily enzyme
MLNRLIPANRLSGIGHWRRRTLTVQPVVCGPVSRVRVSPTVGLANTLINTFGGFVDIGDYVFFGHDVMLLTGTHDFRATGPKRQLTRQTMGRGIVIQSGAWIASRAIIIGPCTIGQNAVIGCGCIVDFDVPPDTVVRVRQEVTKDPIRYRGDLPEPARPRGPHDGR